jgi:hypothetical protein
MSDFDKWIERIYGETDFGRAVATSVAGAVGLITYLAVDDWVIAVFSAVIVFPIARLSSSGLYERMRRASSRRIDAERAVDAYSKLSDEERKVVLAFVQCGASVLTWSQVNSLDISASAIESLIQRDLLGTSMTADGMRETFVMNTDLFDAGLSEHRNGKHLIGDAQ